MSVDTASLNVTSSNYYRDLGAANHIVKFNRTEKEQKATPEVSEAKESIIDQKFGKWEENFKMIQHEPGEQPEHIKWGATVDHPDFKSWLDDTKALVSELGTKVTDEASAKSLSRLLLIMSLKSETDSDGLHKLQAEAFKGVEDILGNLKGKINPDLREAVLALIDPSTNSDLDKKSERLENFVDAAGSHELVKRNSRVLANIQEAFDVKFLQGSEVAKYQDPDGNSIGQQVKDLVKMYIDPVLIYPTDPDAESKQLGPKGQERFKNIRTDIVNAAMSQAKETSSLMKNFEGKTIKYGKIQGEDGTTVDDKREYKGLAGGQTFKEYAQERLNLVREYYIDPSDENRSKLIQHYAKFSEELTLAQQRASIAISAADMLNRLDRKFNNIILYPPELMKSEDAKDSLKVTAQLKIERLESLRETKSSMVSELSKDDLIKAYENLKKSLSTAGVDKSKDIKAAIDGLTGNSSFLNVEDFKTAAKTVENASKAVILSTDTDTLLQGIYTKATELKSRDIDKTIEAEEKALKKLLNINTSATSTVDTSAVKQSLALKVDEFKQVNVDALTGSTGFLAAPTVDGALSKLDSVKNKGLFSLDKSLEANIKLAIDENTNVKVPELRAAIQASTILPEEMKSNLATRLTDDNALVSKKELFDLVRPADGTELSANVKAELEKLINSNKKSSSEADSINVPALNTATASILDVSSNDVKVKLNTIVDNNPSAPDSIKSEIGKLTSNSAFKGAAEQSVKDNTTTQTISDVALDITNKETVTDFIDNLDKGKALELIKASGADSYKIIKEGENISKYKEELFTLKTANSVQLTYLSSVQTNLAKMFMDNFTRSGVEGINRAIFGALETAFIKDNSYAPEGVGILDDSVKKMADSHKATVSALKMNKTYAEAQQASAYQKVIGKMNEFAIGGKDTAIKDQIALVLNKSFDSDQAAFKGLIEKVEETFKDTNHDAFKISPDSRKMIEKPDYNDASYKQRQELEINKVLLSYVDGLYKLSQDKLRVLEDSNNMAVSDQVKHVKALADNKDNNISSTNVSVASNKLRDLSQQVKRTYESFLNSVSEDKIGSELGRALSLDSLISEEKDLASVKIGSKKRLFPAATEFFKNLLASILTSASGGRKDTADELIAQTKEKHGEGALSEDIETHGLVAEIFKEVVTDPSAYRRIQNKMKVA